MSEKRAKDTPADAPGELAEGGQEEAPDAELLALVDHLGGLLERSELAELEVEAGTTSIVLRRAEVATPAPVPVMSAGAAAPVSDVSGQAGGAHAVLAPLTGIFYAAPTPDAPPFVSVGLEVVVGQVIGLIEAMKLFNEIKSDVSGRVQRVLAENGQLVKARDPLIEVALGA